MIAIRKVSAFSLVELSIVLVILGLLTGGILAGQSLIRASELRAVTTEYARYVTSVQTFREKYFAIPGDFPRATAFWLRQVSSGACVSNSGAAVNAATGVCDGDGDGFIKETTSGFYVDERFAFWRHLSAAGLIEGTYSGVPDSNGPLHSTGGVNVPRSRLSNAIWYTSSRPISSVSTVEFTLDYGNYLKIGAAQTNNVPDNAVFKAEEAWNLDTKMDDGLPGQGKVIAADHNGCANATSVTDYAATYRLSFTDVRCRLMFRQAF